MTDMASEMERMNRYLALTGRMRSLMVRAMPSVVDEGVVSGIEEVIAGLSSLVAAPPGPILNAEMLRSSLADAIEWLARAHDSLGNPERAHAEYDRAKEAYRALGKTADVSRIEDAVEQLQLHEMQDIDAELTRLADELDQNSDDGLPRAQLLIRLGEVRTLAGDDASALDALDEAELILSRTEFAAPDADEMILSLKASVDAINAGRGGSGPSPVEAAMHLREIHRRLFNAKRRALRESDPEKAAEYVQKASSLDREQLSPEVVGELMALSREL